MPSFKRFLQGTRGTVSGWIGFYWGKTIEQRRRSTDLHDAFVRQWLEFFVAKGPAFRGDAR
jgi:hypothetical protein